VNPRTAGRMWKISPPSGFDLRTVQPVANHIVGGTRNNRKRWRFTVYLALRCHTRQRCPVHLTTRSSEFSYGGLYRQLLLLLWGSPTKISSAKRRERTIYPAYFPNLQSSFLKMDYRKWTYCADLFSVQPSREPLSSNVCQQYLTANGLQWLAQNTPPTHYKLP
jgi:hypothetical protein